MPWSARPRSRSGAPRTGRRIRPRSLPVSLRGSAVRVEQVRLRSLPQQRPGLCARGRPSPPRGFRHQRPRRSRGPWRGGGRRDRPGLPLLHRGLPDALPLHGCPGTGVRSAGAHRGPFTQRSAVPRPGGHGPNGPAHPPRASACAVEITLITFGGLAMLCGLPLIFALGLMGASAWTVPVLTGCAVGAAVSARVSRSRNAPRFLQIDRRLGPSPSPPTRRRLRSGMSGH